MTGPGYNSELHAPRARLDSRKPPAKRTWHHHQLPDGAGARAVAKNRAVEFGRETEETQYSRDTAAVATKGVVERAAAVPVQVGR